MSTKNIRPSIERIPKELLSHDAFCETHGHDLLCPSRELLTADMGVLKDPKTGHFMKGTKPANKRIMPGRLKDARKLIARITDNGDTILRRLLYLSGAHPELGRQQDLTPSGPVQARALRELREIFWGRTIKLEGKVGVEGQVDHQHDHVIRIDPAAAPAETMTDEELAVFEKYQERLAALPAPEPKALRAPDGADVQDADWEEAVQPDSGDPDPESES